MKRPNLLTLLALIPALAAAGPLDPPYYELAGDYARYPDEYPAQARSMDPYAGGYDPSYPTERQEARGGRQREPRPWVQVPDPIARPGYDAGPMPGAYRDDGGYRSGPGLYEQFAMPYGSPSSAWPSAVREPTLSRPPLPPERRQGYRFRGDERYGADAWGGDFRQGDYRFRPLTDQELDRQRGDLSPWRAPAAYAAPPRRPEVPVGVPDEEAYGYQPDSWFRRYYGERP
jgi:hypothetical protein